MTHSSGTSETVYLRLKAALVEGSIESDARLDVAELAEGFGVSPTPVREAAMRLLGERLLEAHPRGGTRPLLVSELRLGALLEFHARLLTLAVEWTSSEAIGNIQIDAAAAAEDQYRQLFGAIANAPGNTELTAVFDHLCDRLAVFRHVERQIFTDVPRELQTLRAAVASGSAASLKRCLRSYHRRRIAQVAPLAWLAARQHPSAPS